MLIVVSSFVLTVSSISLNSYLFNSNFKYFSQFEISILFPRVVLSQNCTMFSIIENEKDLSYHASYLGIPGHS